MPQSRDLGFECESTNIPSNILTNCSRHPLYTGMCNSLEWRHTEHKEKADPDSYTARYGLNRLVYFERFQYNRNAIAREKQVKRWSRAKKVALIESVNPKWDDLSREWGQPIDFEEIVRKAWRKQKNQDPSTAPAAAGSARDDKAKVEGPLSKLGMTKVKG
ncbi:MAG: GIY-YIG nuclease family protein [Terriglobales bacterium]